MSRCAHPECDRRPELPCWCCRQWFCYEHMLEVLPYYVCLCDGCQAALRDEVAAFEAAQEAAQKAEGFLWDAIRKRQEQQEADDGT
jgi:hypothetical protein